MSFKKFSCFLLLSSIFIVKPCFAIEDVHDELFKPIEISDGSTVTVMDCVAAAFKNSPVIKRMKYNLDVAKSNVGIAKSQYFPVIGAGVGFYNENNSDNRYYDVHYRQLPTVAVTVNKLVWNFGKTTAYIKMEEFYKLGAEYEFMDSLCRTLFDVKEKYYNLLRAKALMQVAQNNVKINEEFLKLAKNKKEPDITTAELNLSQARVQFLEAKNNYNNARIDLDNSMYLDNQPDFKVYNTKTFSFDNDFAYGSSKTAMPAFTPIVFNFPLKDAVQLAYDNSPDLNVLEATKNAMIQSLLYIKRMYFPDLTANAGYGFNNSNLTSNNSFQVGVNLNSSVNLMELRHSIKGADAQVNIAENEITLFKKDLFFEVKRAFNNVDKAQGQVPIAAEGANQALLNLDLVRDKYTAGSLDYVALQRAREDYILAVNKYVSALYDYNMALIQVEMAMHYHIVDIHHKSEHAVHYHSSELIEHLNKALGCDEEDVHRIRYKKKK